MIGPFRGGRTVAISGVPGQPNVFYMAPNNGGVWKTTDFGQTWNPIFDGPPNNAQPNNDQANNDQANDAQRSGSIGALAVAPSNPNTIYVGSGEGLRRPDLSVGNGIYKSTDAGRTGSIWVNGIALCATPSRLDRSSSIPRMRTAFLSPPSASLWSECRAWSLPLARWRPDVAKGSL